MNLVEILTAMAQAKASDVHLKSGAPPLFRIDGELVPQGDALLTPEEVAEMAASLMDEKQQHLFFEDHKEVDLAYVLEGVARFRTNILWQRGVPEIIMRIIPQVIPRLEDINLPVDVLKQIAMEPRGLVLVTGITGSGKSTTLAALINEMNETRRAHIVTIEDPIEFVHQDKKSSITQREVGLDTENFRSALRYVLRQDPDIILIGEMRDVETVSAAISAAETGHLVLSTLHTLDAIQTIERILDFYPPGQQTQIRIQLSNTLRAVISQRLVQRAGGAGVVPACEIMIVTPTIKSLIAEGKISSIRQFIAEGHSQYGMQTFDQSLIELVRKGLITRESALEEATSPSEVDLGLKGISSSKASAQSLISQMESEQQKQRIAAWLRRARDLVQRNRYEEASAELKRILQEEPQHAEANALMSRIREHTQKEEKRKDLSPLLKNGLQLFREGKLQAAVLEFQKVLDADPSHAQAKAYLKMVQERMAAMEDARRLIQAAVTARGQGNLPEAVEKLNQALDVDPTNEKAEEILKEIQAELQKQEARRQAEWFNQQAVEFYKNGDLLSALVTWQRAYDVYPEWEEIATYLQQGTEKLLSFGVDGLEGHPEKEKILALYDQGVRAYVRNDFLTGIEFFKKALEKAPDNAYLKAYLDKSLEMMEYQIQEFLQEGAQAEEAGDLGKARKAYDKIIRLSPGHPQAVQRLQELQKQIAAVAEKLYQEGKEWFDKNEMDRAVRVWKRILEMDPTNDRAKRRIEEAQAKKSVLSNILSKIQ